MCQSQLPGTPALQHAMKRKVPESDQLKILLHNEPEPVMADLRLVQLLSSVAGELPVHDTPVWDLENLLIEYHPVNRSTVVSWLNRGYMIVYSAEFEATGAAEAKNCTVGQAVLLLAFADAVGSTDGLMQSITSYILPSLTLVVTVEGKTMQLKLEDEGYFRWSTGTTTARLQRFDADISTFRRVAELSLTGKQLLQEQVAAQAEQLLHIARKLGLVKLQSRVEMLLKTSLPGTEPLLDVLRISTVVYSPRVLEVMQYTPEEGKRAWIKQLLKRDD